MEGLSSMTLWCLEYSAVSVCSEPWGHICRKPMTTRILIITLIKHFWDHDKRAIIPTRQIQKSTSNYSFTLIIESILLFIEFYFHLTRKRGFTSTYYWQTAPPNTKFLCSITVIIIVHNRQAAIFLEWCFEKTLPVYSFRQIDLSFNIGFQDFPETFH